MKKCILSLMLVLSMALGLMCFSPVTTHAAYGDFSQTILETSITGTTLSVSVTFTGNPSAGIKSFAAVYDAEGTLKGASMRDASSAPITHSITSYTYEEGDYIKTFLWDNYKPVCDIASHVIEDVSVLDSVEGVVVATHHNNPDYENDNNYIELYITKNLTDSADYSVGDIYRLTVDNVNVRNLLGYTVTATVGSSYTVTEISQKSNTASTIEIDTDLILDIDGAEIVYYKSYSAASAASLSIDYTYTENNIVLNGFNENYSLSDYFYTDHLWEYADKILCLDSDSDGDADFIFANCVTESSCEFVVEEVISEEYTVISINGAELYLNEDYNYTFIKDGVISDFDSIEPGDVISSYDTAVGNVTIYVSSNSFEGSIDEIDGDIYTTNNTDYPLSNMSWDLDTDSMDAGNIGIFYINAFGQITYFAPPLDKREYIFVLDAYEDWGAFTTEYVIEAVNGSGETVEYAIEKRDIIVYTPEGIYTDLTEDEAFSYVVDYTGVLYVDFANNGKISTIYFPDWDSSFATENKYTIENTVTYSAFRNIYGIIDISEDTILYNVTSDGVTGGKAVDLLIDGYSYVLTAYGEDCAADVIVTYYAILNEPQTPSVTDSYYAYILAADTVDEDFGSTGYYIKAVMEDGEVAVLKLKDKNIDVFINYSEDLDLPAQAAYIYVQNYTGVVKLALSAADEVTQIYFPDSDYVYANYDYNGGYGVPYSAWDGSLGNISIDENTIIFDFNYDEYTYGDMDYAVTVLNAKDVLQDGEYYSFIAYDNDDFSATDVLVTEYLAENLPDTDEPVDTGYEYVYMLDAAEYNGDFGETEYLIQTVTTANEIEIYALGNNIAFCGDYGYEEGVGADFALEYLGGYTGILILSFNSSDDVSEIHVPECEHFIVDDTYNTYNNKEYSSSRLTYGHVELTQNTMLFNVNTDELEWGYPEDAVICAKAVDMLQDGGNYVLSAYGKEDAPADIIVTTNIRRFFDPTVPVMIVTNVSDYVSNREDTFLITGVMGGEITSVIVDPDDYFGVEGIEPGNVIIFDQFMGYATDIFTLLFSNENGAYEDSLYGIEDIIETTPCDDMVDIAFGEVENTEANYLVTNGIKYYYTDNCNFTLVDYTNGMTISPCTKSDLKASGYTSYYVFVKTAVDSVDEVTDVVIFKNN